MIRRGNETNKSSVGDNRGKRISSYVKALRKRNRKFFKKSLALGHINRAAKMPIKRKWDS